MYIKLTKVIKSVLRAAYGASIANLIQKQFGDFKTRENIESYVLKVVGLFWKDGVWITESTPVKSEAEKLEARNMAREIFVDGKLFDIDAIARVVGRNNTRSGLNRVFELVQDREMNRWFVCHVIEALLEEALTKAKA